jgi:hypothetical protein
VFHGRFVQGTGVQLHSIVRADSEFIHGLKAEVSRDSVVGKDTDYGLEDREFGVRVPVG